jgi:hypothetical protein
MLGDQEDTRTPEGFKPESPVFEPSLNRKPEFTPINNEAFRTYVFANGGKVTITAPVSLSVRRKPEGDSHRIIDAEGTSHYIPAGWIHLFWRGKDSTPAYSF